MKLNARPSSMNAALGRNSGKLSLVVMEGDRDRQATGKPLTSGVSWAANLRVVIL